MSRVESETERMSHLVEDMLLLARLDAGPDLDLQPCDLSEIVINGVTTPARPVLIMLGS
jgi:two-component system OmpR family sensor kinase